jgi:excisionase family DNA binding protein
MAENRNFHLFEVVNIHTTLLIRKTAWKIPELAELLNLGRRTVYEAVESGSLPAFKIGTAVRVNPIDALEWFEARTTGIRIRQSRLAA